MRTKLPAKSEVHFSSLHALNGKSHMSNLKSLFYNGIFSQVATAHLGLASCLQKCTFLLWVYWKKLLSNDLRKECSTTQYHPAISSDCFSYNNERHESNVWITAVILQRQVIKEMLKRFYVKEHGGNSHLLAFILIRCIKQHSDPTLK